jgi:hypothetical protein
MDKECCTCKNKKPPKYFNKCKSKHDGLQSRCRDCMTLDKLKRRYQLSDEQIIKIQLKDSCECCNVILEQGNDSWNSKHIDHDHSTGLFRGVLCKRCNMTLGQCKDDINYIQQLKNYLHGII